MTLNLVNLTAIKILQKSAPMFKCETMHMTTSQLPYKKADLLWDLFLHCPAMYYMIVRNCTIVKVGGWLHGGSNKTTTLSNVGMGRLLGTIIYANE